MKIDQEMSLDFSRAALAQIADGCENHAKIIRLYATLDLLKEKTNGDMAIPFENLAKACQEMIALQERRD